MKSVLNNYAFIDSQNLNLSIRYQEWILDFRKFRQYLSRKYGVTRAFLFIGYVYQNQDLVFMNNLRGMLEYDKSSKKRRGIAVHLRRTDWPLIVILV